MSEDEKKRYLENIMDEDEDSDEIDSQNQNANLRAEDVSRNDDLLKAAAINEKKQKDDKQDGNSGEESLSDEEDILNRSLDSGTEAAVIDPTNYFRFVSERYSSQNDMVELVDKNERSFKQIAEQLIGQTNKLLAQDVVRSGVTDDQSQGAPSRRLMH